MRDLKLGMYVRCSIDVEDPNNPRLFAMGQVVKIDETSDEVTVTFHDLAKVRSFFEIVPGVNKYSLDTVRRCKVLNDSEVYLNKYKEKGTIICNNSKDEGGYFNYFVRLQEEGRNRIEVMSEKDLKVQFTRAEISPVTQLLKYELQNPIWYHYRHTVSNSMHTLKNATFGFETLVGSRVFLLPHQVDTIVRCVLASPCRFMLADEVGLGKTIEACVIMKGLKKRIGELKTLVVAPESLIHQWQNELSFKFWLDFPIWSDDGLIGNDLIFPLEKINTPEGQKILEWEWDLCIIDETHRLLGMESEYQQLLAFSKITEHMLLLSATPIQQRRTEYLKLLTLLVPERYERMTEYEFTQLLEKQDVLRSNIHQMVRDLDDYEVDDLAEDYRDDLEDIADELGDKTFSKIINEIDIDAEDQGLGQVRLALAYIGEHYQIERHIIRHRRMELKDSMPARSFEIVNYPMAGADYNFYELDSYEELLSYLQAVLEHNDNSKTTGDYIRLFFSAMFSSPFAILKLLQQRKEFIKSDKIKDISHNGKKQLNTLFELETFSSEDILLDGLLYTCKQWRDAVKDEFARLDELYNDPDMIKGRLVKAIDYLSEAIEHEKFVIFTSWTETLKPMEKILQSRFGQNSVTSFYSEKSDDELQDAADKFQSDAQCRFMLCDELGGEGRNFQVAEAILHLDLPWSPAQLEQRIGRLDRIGRDKDVLSVVFCTQETVEADLFNLWNEGLKIFTESLSGLEIALDEIHKRLLYALGSDLRFGLAKELESINTYSKEMRKLVEEERYFDMAKQLDTRVEDQLTKLIEKFDAQEGQRLYDTMMEWSGLTGLNASHVNPVDQTVLFTPKGFRHNSMNNTLFIPPDLEKARQRAKRSREIKGTFSRKVAIEREDLIFYAPSDPFFDAIVTNALECSRGRCCAYARPATIEWKGFVYTWAPEVNPVPLLKIGEDIESLVLAQGYIPLEQIITFEGLSPEDKEVDEVLIKQELSKGYRKQDCAHLGKRDPGRDFLMVSAHSNLEWFKSQFPLDLWNKSIKKTFKSSKSEAMSKLLDMLEFKQAENDFQRKIDGLKAANLYYGRESEKEYAENQRMIKLYEALLKGLEKPRLHLDSIAYVWLVKEND